MSDLFHGAAVMTQQELLEQARQGNPGVRYAASTDGHAIGAWNEGLGRFQVVLCYTITGEWVIMPFEVLLNGEPPYKPDQWKEG